MLSGRNRREAKLEKEDVMMIVDRRIGERMRSRMRVKVRGLGRRGAAILLEGRVILCRLRKRV